MNYNHINRLASYFKEHTLVSPQALNREVPALRRSIPNSIGIKCTGIEWYSLQDLTGMLYVVWCDICDYRHFT